jgi:hypothetical protein
MRVLTTASAIGCGHPPGAVGTQSTAKLTVASHGVLTVEGVLGHGVSDCPIADSSSTVKCRTVSTVSGGKARALTVQGQAVVVEETLAGTTSGTGGAVSGQLTADAQQATLAAS